MATVGSVFKSTLVIISAAIVVLMGAQELRRNSLKKQGRTPMPDMIKMFHGDIDIAKGKIADQAEQVKLKASERAKYEENMRKESLSGEDGNQIKNLLDKLAP